MLATHFTFLCIHLHRISVSLLGMSSIQVDPEIVRMLAETDAGNRGNVVATVDDIMGRLESSGLAYLVQIPPSLVGVHPMNRNGYGLSPIEVHALGADITKLGWSWVACSHDVCIEGKGSIIGRLTEQLTSQPGLARQKSSVVKYGSLSC